MKTLNFFQMIFAGGPVMIPILLCSILALAIVIEKIKYLSTVRLNGLNLKTKILELVKHNKAKDAIAYCETHASPLANVLKAGILKTGQSRREIKEEMEEVSLLEIPFLQRRLPALATLSHTSVLLGLLGTVTGMISSFQTIQTQAVTLNAVTVADLAGGVWQALITTVAGLIVAIPAYVAYNYCINEINVIVLGMEKSATELLTILGQYAPGPMETNIIEEGLEEKSSL